MRGILGVLATISFGGCASLAAGDMTGMVPGDVVVSNLTNSGPGHAGIYIGRWTLLPKGLQERFAGTLQEAAVRSGCAEILDSYLVVDSMPGRGVRVAPMVEQFSDYHGGTNAYFPLLKKFDMAGALRFENDKGMAMKWGSLPDNDSRRWKIVESALECAAKRVPYDDRHGQLATTSLGESLRAFSRGQLQLDCVSLPQFAYWYGAKIDLDVSWWPFHTPAQLYDYAKEHQLWRPVSFLPLLRDTAYLGMWKLASVSVRTTGMTRAQAEAAKDELGYFPADTRFQIRRLATDMVFSLQELRSGDRQGDPLELKLNRMAASPIQAGRAEYTRSESGTQATVWLQPTSSEQATMTTTISSDGKSATVTVLLQRERSVRKLVR